LFAYFTTVADDAEVLDIYKLINFLKLIVTEEATEHILFGILMQEDNPSVYTNTLLLTAFILEDKGIAREVTNSIRAFTLVIVTVKLDITDNIRLTLVTIDKEAEEDTLFITIGFLFTVEKSDVADTACKV
jgi:hypothetical protein